MNQGELKQHKDGMFYRPWKSDLTVIGEMSQYKSLPFEGSRVLDVGANIGAFTIYALKHGAMHVTALEPEKDNFEILSLNTISSHKVELLNVAVAKSDGTASLYLNAGKNAASHTLVKKRGRNEVTVATVSLSSLFAKGGFSVVKIDIEGYEMELLESFTFPPCVHAVAVEFHFNNKALVEGLPDIAKRIDMQFSYRTRTPKFGTKLWYTLGIWSR
jgi:FkbM family methyltransferase